MVLEIGNDGTTNDIYGTNLPPALLLRSPSTMIVLKISYVFRKIFDGFLLQMYTATGLVDEIWHLTTCRKARSYLILIRVLDALGMKNYQIPCCVSSDHHF